ncbi:glycosyltransferase family 2 protein [Cellulomonas fimi]|uniref:glycosyltransferase family 2 protein n=1 Tax=Cellulomonas sp. RIT-PI-Y TaxID=3035297 RepID=UPI0021D856CA
MIRIRVLVVTWQAATLLPPCLDSIRSQEIPDAEVEIVVLDNASTDGSVELLARDYPEVRVIGAERNLGFAGGVARGLDDFHGDVAVLLNNDARMLPGALAALVEPLRAPGRLAATTARILLAGRYRRTDRPVSDSPDGRSPWQPDEAGGVRLVNSTGNVITRNGTGADRDWLTPAEEENAAPEVFGFCGGAAALRWPAVRAVGGIDPGLFLYYEDTDLSWRLRAAGHDIRYQRAAEVEHLHSASSGTSSPLFRYQNTRNSLTVVTRHAPAALVLASWLRQSAGLVRSILRGPRAESAPRARGIRDALLRLPRTLGERRRIWSHAARGRREALDPRS